MRTWACRPNLSWGAPVRPYALTSWDGGLGLVDRFDDAPARTWVDVDLSALRHNTAVLTPPESTLLVMVKGNAYGHGAVEVARTVLDAGAQWLGVSFVDEGIALRASDIDMVYLTGYGFPLHRGGPMNYADTVGLFNVVQSMKRFAANPHDDAEFWKPAPLLAKLVAEGKSFS